MELYSGQGRVNLTKRRADGKVDPRERFFVGNVPHFSVNFLTGEVSMTVDEMKDEVLEIVCGSAVRRQLQQIVPSDHHVDGDAVGDVSEFEIGDSAPFEYQLLFQGVNTAMTNNAGRFPRWRVYLHRVTFTAGEGWSLIGDDIVSIKVSGMAHKDELNGNKRGLVQRIHNESVSGLRSQDLRLDKAAA